MLRSTATRGRSSSMSSSWKLESSQTIQASFAIAPSRPVSGRPTFPATATAPPGRAEDLSQELARGRLPVRAGDAEQRIRQDPRAELDLAPDGQAARACRGHEGRLARDTGALDQQVHVVDERGVLRAQDDFDAGSREACRRRARRFGRLRAPEPHGARGRAPRPRPSGRGRGRGLAQEANSDA